MAFSLVLNEAVYSVYCPEAGDIPANGTDLLIHKKDRGSANFSNIVPIFNI